MQGQWKLFRAQWKVWEFFSFWWVATLSKLQGPIQYQEYKIRQYIILFSLNCKCELNKNQYSPQSG